MPTRQTAPQTIAVAALEVLRKTGNFCIINMLMNKHWLHSFNDLRYGGFKRAVIGVIVEGVYVTGKDFRGLMGMIVGLPSLDNHSFPNL